MSVLAVPRWRDHPSWRKNPWLAAKVFMMLDMPGPVHLKWRRFTHRPDVAYVIGWLVGKKYGNPKLGAELALKHVLEDLIWASRSSRRK